MNRNIPNMVLVNKRFSNVTGENYLQTLNSELEDLKNNLKKEEDYKLIHEKNYKDNLDSYNLCLSRVGANSGPYAGTTKEICDSQSLPNVTAEEKKILDSKYRIDDIKAAISAKKTKIEEETDRQIDILREKSKTDPVALAQLKELEGSKITKTVIIVIGSIIGIGVIIGLIYYFKKKKSAKIAA